MHNRIDLRSLANNPLKFALFFPRPPPAAGAGAAAVSFAYEDAEVEEGLYCWNDAAFAVGAPVAAGVDGRWLALAYAVVGRAAAGVDVPGCAGK